MCNDLFIAGSRDLQDSPPDPAGFGSGCTTDDEVSSEQTLAFLKKALQMCPVPFLTIEGRRLEYLPLVTVIDLEQFYAVKIYFQNGGTTPLVGYIGLEEGVENLRGNLVRFGYRMEPNRTCNYMMY